MTFIIGIFQFHRKSDLKLVKWNKIKRDVHKPESIPIALLNYFCNLFLKKAYLKKNNISFKGNMPIT